MQARTSTKAHKHTSACAYQSMGLQIHSLPKVDYVVDLNSENPCHIENPHDSRSVHPIYLKPDSAAF
jgi:hypothetical protein